jgi:hypothetical protein
MHPGHDTSLWRKRHTGERPVDVSRTGKVNDNIPFVALSKQKLLQIP